jgi:outer membrane protein assembly factor BamB
MEDCSWRNYRKQCWHYYPYVGSLDNNTYCLDASSGNVIWKFPTGGPVFSTPSVADNVVYMAVSTPEDTLYAIKADTGSQIWKKVLTAPTPLDVGMFSSCTLANGVIYIGVKDYYYAVDAATGNIKWTYQCHDNGAPVPGSVLYVKGLLYFPDYFDLICVNASNAEPVWKTWLGRQVASSPTYAAGKVYIGSDDGSLRVLDALEGTKISSYYSGVQWWSSPSLVNGYMYVGSLDNNVYCFGDSVIGTTYYGSASAAVPTPTPTLAPTMTASSSTVPNTGSGIGTEGYIAIAVVVIAAVAVTAAALVLRKRK